MNFAGKNEKQAREEILSLVKEYCAQYHNQKSWQEGDRISYASRVYDSDEMVNLVDSGLEFWLTSGRYTDRFEREFAKYLGVPYCSLVNSGSSANLLAFMALTSPLLGERAALTRLRPTRRGICTSRARACLIFRVISTSPFIFKQPPSWGLTSSFARALTFVRNGSLGDCPRGSLPTKKCPCAAMTRPFSQN